MNIEITEKEAVEICNVLGTTEIAIAKGEGIRSVVAFIQQKLKLAKEKAESVEAEENINNEKGE